MKRGKKSRVLKIILILLAILLAIALFFLVFNQSINADVVKSSGLIPPGQKEIKITYKNIESEIGKNAIFKSIPSKTTILLRFYNFDSGERTWENSYIIKKGSIKKGITNNPDVTITLSSKYLNSLTNKNFCTIIKEARKNGDFGFSTNIPTYQLLWKFRNSLKYRNCFGY